MKKILFILLCVFSLSFSAYSSEVNWGKKPTPMCTKVGNVNAVVDEYKGEVRIVNTNKYDVTVKWKAYGYTEDGTQHFIGGSTTTVKGNYGEAKPKVRISDKYISYSVDIEVTKCN